MFLIIGTYLYANGPKNDSLKQKNPQDIYSSLEWKQAFFNELTVRLQKSSIPPSTLMIVFKEVSVSHLSKNPKAAAEKVFYWARKYDLKLRKGYSSSQVILELKREIALDSDDNNENELLISIYIYDEYEKLKIKDKKDKKDKDLKDKIKKIKKDKKDK